MKRVLIASMLAIAVSSGAALAQAQSGEGSNCASGATNCQKATPKSSEQGKTGQQAEGKAKTNDQAQGKAGNKDQQAQDNVKKKSDQQAQGKAGTATDQQAQGNVKKKTDQQAQGKAGTATDQQAQDSVKKKTDQQAQGKTGTATDQQAQGNVKPKTNQQVDTSKQTPDKNSTASINNVTVEQKTRITQVFREVKVEPVASVDFDVSVGVRIPHKVRLHRLPPRIVEIIPDYESYEYFELADGRIVIVDPDSLQIVLILT